MRTLLAALALALSVTVVHGATIVLKPAGVVDVVAGRVNRDQSVLVVDGVIKAVGKDLAVPAGATVVALPGEYLAPGLMDAHTHLTLTETPEGAPFESFYLAESSAYRAIRGVHNAEALLHQGFTAVRDVGNDGEWIMADVKRGAEAGLFDGPTIVTSGKIITPFGGQSHGIPAERGSFWAYEYLDADTPEEMRKAVRKNLYYGAGVIKLVTDNNPYHASIEEIRAAVDEAHKGGVPVAVHVYGGAAAQAAIDAGVDSIEHGFDLTDAQLTTMKSKGIYLVGTDMPRSVLDIVGTSGGIFPPPDVLEPKILDRLKRAHRIGVKMAFGSDVVIEQKGRTRADLMLDFLSTWKKAGIPAADTLRAWTVSAAELLRIDDKRGRIAVGLAADLVAMPADPLADIEALRKIDFVMKDGRIVRHDAH